MGLLNVNYVNFRNVDYTTAMMGLPMFQIPPGVPRVHRTLVRTCSCPLKHFCATHGEWTLSEQSSLLNHLPEGADLNRISSSAHSISSPLPELGYVKGEHER